MEAYLENQFVDFACQEDFVWFFSLFGNMDETAKCVVICPHGTDLKTSYIHFVVGACCESILISNSNQVSSPLFQYPQNPVDIFMGLYRQAGEVNGGPIYRRVGSLNMWLARFVPLSSFTKVWSNTLARWAM